MSPTKLLPLVAATFGAATLVACGGGGSGASNPLIGHWKLASDPTNCPYSQLDFQATQQVLTLGATGQTTTGAIQQWVYVPGGNSISFIQSGGTVTWHLLDANDIQDDSPWMCRYQRG